MQVKHCLVVCTLLCGRLAAQEFNVTTQNQVQGFASGLSVKELPEGYLVFSVQRGLSNTPQDPFVSLYDHFGQLVWEHDLVISRLGFLGIPDPVCRVPGGGFASGLSTFGSASPIDSVFLWRFNGSGDTTFTRFLVADTTMTMRKCIRTRSGDFVFTGLHEYPREQYVLRTDSLGTIKDFFGFDDIEGNGIAEDAEGNFYLTGRRIADDLLSLIKCDSVGAFEWSRFTGPQGTWRTPVVLADSSVLVLGAWQQPPNGYLVAKTSNYSSTGELLWTHDVIQSTNGNYAARMTDAYQRADGTIVTAGYYERAGDCYCGLVQTYSPEGDSLWSTKFTHYELLGNNDHFIWDLEPTSDGGMVLTGEARDELQPGSSVNLWLVKLDSLGCVVPGCQSVGIQEQYTNLGDALRLWPNPVWGQLHVSMTLPAGYTAVGEQRLVVVDATGAVVRQQRVPSSSPEDFLLNVQGLTTGSYTVHLTDGRRWLAGSKVIVE